MDPSPAPDVFGTDTTSADSVPHDIYHVTNACVRSLQECLSVPELMGGAWAENRLADFNLWAAGVGASTTSRASLDWRLRFQPEVRIVLTSLLVTLKNFTDECKDIASRSGHGGSAVDDNGRFWLQEDPESEDAPSEAASWFDALDSDLGDEAPLGATTIPSDVGEDISSGPLSEAMKHTQDVLNQLIRLGYAIRKSGTNSRLRRADGSFRQGDHKAFQNYLSLILRTGTSTELHDQHTTANERVMEAQDSYGQLTPEQTQLVLANLRRRHRFLYARRHQQKLDSVPPQRSIIPEVKLVYLPDETGRTVAPSQAPQSVVERLEHRVKVTEKPAGSGMTTTAASAVDGNILGGAAEISQAASRMSATAAKLSYPSAPPETLGMMSFKCPCCCQTLPDMFRSRSRWRKHLSEDLCPYTCPFADCQDTSALYHNRATWKAHIHERHCTSLWECLLCTGMGRYVAFYTASHFGSHMREHHRTTVSEPQIEGLHDLCRRLVPPHLPSCPLCSTAQQDWNSLDPEGRIDHLGDCIHEFSLRALPWAQSLPEPTTYLRVPGVDEKVSAWFDTIDRPELEGYDQGLSFLPFPDDVPVSDEIYLANEYFGGSSKGSSRAREGSASWDHDLSKAESFHIVSSGQPSAESNQSDASEVDWVPSGHEIETKGQKGKEKAAYEDLDQVENDGDRSSLPLKPYDTSTPNISNAGVGSPWGDWGDWVWSPFQNRYYCQRESKHGELETRWGPLMSTSAKDQDQSETPHYAITGEENTPRPGRMQRRTTDEEIMHIGRELTRLHSDIESRPTGLKAQDRDVYDRDGPRRKDRGRGRSRGNSKDQYMFSTADSNTTPRPGRMQRRTTDEEIMHIGRELSRLHSDIESRPTSLKASISKKDQGRGIASSRPYEGAYSSDDEGGEWESVSGSKSGKEEDFLAYGSTPSYPQPPPPPPAVTPPAVEAPPPGRAALDSLEDPSNSIHLERNMDSWSRDHDSGGVTPIPDPRYHVVSPHIFQPGVVFKLIWPMPSGRATGTTTDGVLEKYGVRIHVGIRTFIVVAADAGHSTCVYITTYGGRGCKVKGVKPEKHGMVVMNGARTKRLDGEPKLGFPPVRAVFNVPGETLSAKSCIDYSKLVTVEHNVNVFVIGSIHYDDEELVVDAVNHCWESKTFSRSQR